MHVELWRRAKKIRIEEFQLCVNLCQRRLERKRDRSVEHNGLRINDNQMHIALIKYHSFKSLTFQCKDFGESDGIGYICTFSLSLSPAHVRCFHSWKIERDRFLSDCSTSQYAVELWVNRINFILRPNSIQLLLSHEFKCMLESRRFRFDSFSSVLFDRIGWFVRFLFQRDTHVVTGFWCSSQVFSCKYFHGLVPNYTRIVIKEIVRFQFNLRESLYLICKINSTWLSICRIVRISSNWKSVYRILGKSLN